MAFFKSTNSPVRAIDQPIVELLAFRKRETDQQLIAAKQQIERCAEQQASYAFQAVLSTVWSKAISLNLRNFTVDELTKIVRQAVSAKFCIEGADRE